MFIRQHAQDMGDQRRTLETDGRILSWSWDNTLRLWSLDGHPLATLTGHTDWVGDAVQLADGRILSWSEDNSPRLWSSDGQPLAELSGHTSSVRGACQLPDGRILSWSADKTLRLWSSDGQPLAELSGHTSSVRGARQLPDGRILSWSEDKTLRLWSSDGQFLVTLVGHNHSIWGGRQLPDGRILSSAADDTLRLWSSDGQPLAVLEQYQRHPESEARVQAWGAQHGVTIDTSSKSSYWSDPSTLNTAYAGYVAHRLWVMGAGKFIGDAEFTRVAVSGQTIAVGDDVGRVIFLRVRGG